MKVNVKKALATMMAAALIVTSAQCPTASAAKKPKLNSKKVTLTVGKKKTLKVKNKIKGSTYTWKSSKVKVAKVTKKGVVKAVKAGTATITCKVKTKATKKKKAKTYTLKCKVTVKKKKTTKPTAKPTAKPTTKPSTKPSDVPSNNPSDTPSQAPSDNPSTAPSTEPSVSPSADPSASPSVSPSVSPSASPTTTPSYNYRPGGSSSKPGTTPKPTETDAPAGSIAKTEAELKDLAAKGTKEITLQPTGDITIEADANYEDVKLTVNAPNSTITNKAQFASIDIKAIKADTWIEAGLNTVKNIIKVLTASAHVKVEEGSAVKSIEVAPETAPKENETVTITAGGSVEKVEITAENPTINPNVTIKADSKNEVQNVTVTTIANVTITKNTTATTVTDNAIPVTVTISDTTENDADKLVLTSSVPVAITAETATNAEIKLEEGAGGSTVSVATEAAGDCSVKITNSSGKDVTVNNETLSTNDNKTITVQEDPVKAIQAAITEKAILGENSAANAVTKNLILSTDLSTYGCTVTGASISWSATYDPTENSEALDTKTGAVKQLESTTTVILTLTITPDSGSADNTTKFTLTIPGTKEENTAPTISLSSVSYTVANTTTSGSSIVATTGTSITVTANADVKQGETSVTEGVKYEFVSSDNNSTAPTTGFAESSTIVLGAAATDKYLWVKVTVGTGDSATTAYFASTDKITLSNSTSFSMKSVK